MKLRAWSVVVVSLVASVLVSSTPRAQAPDEFQKRRQAVRDLMEPDSVMVVRNTPVDPGTLRPDPNFFYLTGIEDSAPAALVLFASKRNVQPSAEGLVPISIFGGRDGVVLFKTPPAVMMRPGQPPPAVPPPPPPGQALTVRPGQALPPQPQALEQAGFAANTVRGYADFQSFFDRVLLMTTGTFYLDYRRSMSLSAPMTEDEQLVKQARDRGAAMTLKPASSLLAPLRAVKSADEILLLKQAAEITAAGAREAMRAAKPGLFEYQLQSVIEHVFTINGARRPGFSTIAGSGPNSCIVHWNANTRQTKPGDLVVLDIGAEYQKYTADITRTIPISGTFTKRQRDVYEIVLQANEQAIAMMKPGVSMREVSVKVNDVLGDGLLKLGLIKDKAETVRYSLHPPSHSIGLLVHDVGSTAVLQPGMVVTMEPGLYLPEEELGIRIEDDVLITETGCEVITASAPKSVAAVEALMKSGGGIDFSRYLVRKTGMH